MSWKVSTLSRGKKWSTPFCQANRSFLRKQDAYISRLENCQNALCLRIRLTRIFFYLIINFIRIEAELSRSKREGALFADVTRDEKHFFPTISSALGPRHDLRTALWRVFQRVLFTGYSNLFHPLEKGERLSGNAETMRASRLKGSSFSVTSRRAMIPPSSPAFSSIRVYARPRTPTREHDARHTFSSVKYFVTFFFFSIFRFLTSQRTKICEEGSAWILFFTRKIFYFLASLIFAFSRKIMIDERKKKEKKERESRDRIG